MRRQNKVNVCLSANEKMLLDHVCDITKIPKATLVRLLTMLCLKEMLAIDVDGPVVVERLSATLHYDRSDRDTREVQEPDD